MAWKREEGVSQYKLPGSGGLDVGLNMLHILLCLSINVKLKFALEQAQRRSIGIAVLLL
jgi:hypothetical protein